MKRIYIAGKYDDVDVVKVLLNIRAGIETAVLVLKNGDIPFCPFLDFLFILIGEGKELSTQVLRDYSMSWLEVCDEVWFLPSWTTSGGCKTELARAEELGKVVKFI